MSTMTTPRKRKKKAAQGGQPPKRVRTGDNLNVWVRSDLVAALNKYLATSMPRVSKTAAVEAALIRFLQEQGQWPPAQPAPGDEG